MRPEPGKNRQDARSAWEETRTQPWGGLMVDPGPVIVLGGRGFVGSALVERCRSEGFECEAIGRQDRPAARGRRCRWLLDTAGNSRKYLADDDPVEDLRRSVLTAGEALFDFAYDLYVLISSVDVYASPGPPSPRNRETATLDPAAQSNYGYHKSLAEQLVRRYARRWLILRLGGQVGPGLWKGPVHDLLHDVPLRVSPRSRYQLMHTADTARLALAIVGSGAVNQVVNLVPDGTLSLREIVEMALERQSDAPELPVEHYEVDNRKLHCFGSVPRTEDCVRRFLEERRATVP